MVDRLTRLIPTLLLIASAGWAQTTPAPQPVRGYLSQIASGGLWKTTLTLLNPTGAQTDVNVVFRGSDGLPLTLNLVVSQGGARLTRTSSELSLRVQPLATVTIETEALDSAITLTGWAEVISLRRFAGSAIFRQRTPDGRLIEAMTPLDYSPSPSVVFPFDNREGAATGVALVNPTVNQALLVVRTRNENGIETEISRFLLGPNGHTAFNIDDQFEAASGQGTIEFVAPSGGRLIGLGLRFGAGGGFTSIPVIRLAEALPTQP